MKIGIFTYCCALLLAFLFLFKGLSTVLPGSFFKGQKAFETVLLMEKEAEENKKSGEKNLEEYGSEQYTLIVSQYNITGVYMLASTQLQANINTCYPQLVYLSIPTPPPERA